MRFAAKALGVDVGQLREFLADRYLDPSEPQRRRPVGAIDVDVIEEQYMEASGSKLLFEGSIFKAGYLKIRYPGIFRRWYCRVFSVFRHSFQRVLRVGRC